MTLSLNEAQAAAKKAARGAGFDWGTAEEAGAVVRWLCAHGLDGCAALSDHLQRVNEAGIDGLAPVSLGGAWRGRSGRLGALQAGAALSDGADALTSTPVRMENVLDPLLLIPFAAAAAARLDRPISTEWFRARAVTDGEAVSLDGEAEAWRAGVAETVTVSVGGALDARVPKHSRADPAPAAWDALNRFAARTYAPATEASRTLGAGAGASDND